MNLVFLLVSVVVVLAWCFARTRRRMPGRGETKSTRNWLTFCVLAVTTVFALALFLLGSHNVTNLIRVGVFAALAFLLWRMYSRQKAQER